MGDLFEGTWSSSNGIIRENVDFSISSTVRFYLNTNTKCFPPHWHLAGEVIAPLQNGYEVTVGGDVLELSPRDILVISPSELHSINAPPSGARYIINYAPDPLEQITDMVVLFSQLRPYYLLREQDNPELSDQLLRLLRQIEAEYNDDAPYREGAILTSLINFFVRLGRDAIAEDSGSGQPRQQRYTDQFIMVCNYINMHCTENLTLEGVAEYVGFSKYHFSRLFKKFVNTTFHEYLTTSRLLHAKKLLVDSSTPVTEIALHSGFNSVATFNRIFKSEMGCTPSEYRNLNVSASRPLEF